MTQPRRRWLASALVASLVVAAGCGGLGGPSGPTTHDPQSGYITAEAVDSVPENETVVNFSSETAGDYGKLETALRRAIESNESAVVSLDGRGIDRATAALADAPRGSDAYWYVRYDGTVVSVVVAAAG